MSTAFNGNVGLLASFSSNPLILWTVLVTGSLVIAGVGYLCVLLFRRVTKPPPKDEEALTKLEVEKTHRLPVSVKFKSFTSVRDAATEDVRAKLKFVIEDMKLQGSLVSSESRITQGEKELIRGILAGGPIPWSLYVPSTKANDDKTSISSNSADSAEADITDISAKGLTTPGLFSTGPISAVIPDLETVYCASVPVLKDADISIQIPTTSLVVDDDPDIGHLQLPIASFGRSSTSSSYQCGRCSHLTGNQPVFGLPISNNKLNDRPGRNHAFTAVGGSKNPGGISVRGPRPVSLFTLEGRMSSVSPSTVSI